MSILILYYFNVPKLRIIRFVGSSYKDLLAAPKPVRQATGFVLDRVQRGRYHSDISPLKGKDFAGVYEIRTDYDSDTYRAVYAINIGEAIYVLDVFQKKSKRGVETPKQDLDRIQNRLKLAKELARDE